MMDEQLAVFIDSLETDSGYAESTRQAYASDIYQYIHYLNQVLGRKPKASDFTSESSGKFLEVGRKSGMKPSTLHRKRVSLKRFAEFLSDQNILDHKTVETISGLQENLWREISKQKVACLKPKEVDRLFRAIEMVEHPRAYRDLAIFSLLIETGMSIGTIISLDLSDVNLREKKVRMGDTLDDHNWFTFPKSMERIRKYLEEGRPDLTQSLNEKALFVSQMGDRITRQGVWQVLKSWGRQAKLKKTLSPRVLRHTAVKNMILEGMTVGEIQKMLGHTNQLSTRALVRRIKKACNVK